MNAVRRREPTAESGWGLALPVAAGLVVGLGSLSLIWWLARSLALLVVALTLAQALSPLVDRVEQRLSRTLAVVLVYALLLLPGLLLLAWAATSFLTVALALLASPTTAVLVISLYVALQQLEGHVVTPNVMKSQTEINPALVIFAITAGFAVAGVLGAITAVPLFAAVQVLALSVLAPALRRRARSGPTIASVAR